jgi:hypothetical protein
MPLLINKTTHEVLDVRDETLFDENEWLILSAAWLAEHGMPTFDRSLWRYSNGIVVEATPSSADLLATAKANKLSEITTWYETKLATGFDTGNGYHLAATFSDQTRFTQDAVLQQQLLSLGSASGTDLVGFLDAAYGPQVLSIADYLILLADYGSWCRSKLLERATLTGQAMAATTVEQVAAVVPIA